ncbi:nucleoside deaminase [Metarhizium album ARSEF 1941]|uniref:Nucleoside deaminase n=1 Tax=Metarhizium album (strain ARSEF 1941) TaxID=1081103 RepID=A0A0B2WPK1_METAS|nr:nucleoside deaminase [Metarhizium album ARSEF 1941]KHN97971.1 nucleoside deaminase [Metarhizium album ARSEF 1941]
MSRQKNHALDRARVIRHRFARRQVPRAAPNLTLRNVTPHPVILCSRHNQLSKSTPFSPVIERAKAMKKLISRLIAATTIGLLAREPSRACFANGADAPDIPPETRSYWMRRATATLFEVTGSPCPMQAFGTVVVNHTAGGLGELVCVGANDVQSGNPTLHGEMAAIGNCSAILTDPNGRYKLSGREALKAWAELTLYTNAEPCPMCASAIRWAGFREVVFGSSIESLRARHWRIMTLPAEELFKYTTDLPAGRTAIVGGVLANETDPYFSWQYTRGASCPRGCQMEGSKCSPATGGSANSEHRDALGHDWGWLKRSV